MEINLDTSYWDYSPRLKLKRIWFEHIKRRPALIKNMSSIWRKAHEERCETMKDTSLKVFPYKDPELTSEELRIINTPIEQLMEEYKQSLK